jgi:hypothetical protein
MRDVMTVLAGTASPAAPIYLHATSIQQPHARMAHVLTLDVLIRTHVTTIHMLFVAIIHSVHIPDVMIPRPATMNLLPAVLMVHAYMEILVV